MASSTKTNSFGKVLFLRHFLNLLHILIIEDLIISDSKEKHILTEEEMPEGLKETRIALKKRRAQKTYMQFLTNNQGNV
jgi:hypothetical protein